MDDLIRRKDAIKAVESLPNCYNGFSDTYDKACFIGLLEEVPAMCKFWDAESNYCALYRPSAQPEIIKCKDCKFWHEDVANFTSIQRGGCKLVRGITNGEFFCALGERKEINSR